MKKANIVFALIVTIFFVAAIVAFIHFVTMHGCSVWGPSYEEWQNGHNVIIRRCIW